MAMTAKVPRRQRGLYFAKIQGRQSLCRLWSCPALNGAMGTGKTVFVEVRLRPLILEDSERFAENSPPTE